MDLAVGVDVDGLDLLAVDDDRQAAATGRLMGIECLLGVSGVEQAAAAEGDAAGGGSSGFEEVSPSRH